MDAQRKELDAFMAFFATYELVRPVATVADLSDGAPLFEILGLMSVQAARSIFEVRKLNEFF